MDGSKIRGLNKVQKGGGVLRPDLVMIDDPQTPTVAHCRQVDEWRQRANCPDNHWFDCFVSLFVAASMLGVAIPGTESANRKNRQPPGSRPTLPQLRGRKREEVVTRSTSRHAVSSFEIPPE